MARHYQETIHRLDPTVNPAGVEASMRLQYGTLDHLAKETFVEEIQVAKAAKGEQPGYLHRVADSYGLAQDYTEWEPKLQSAPTPTPNPPFTGVRITNRLHLWPSDEHPGMWDICGKDSHLSALAEPKDLVRLAQTILQHFTE